MKGRILVVDDYPPAVAVVGDALREAGYDVLPARDGAEALLVAQAEGPDLVILDLRMPGPHGLDVLRALGALPGRRPPVIILSVSDDEEEQMEAFARGADLFLTKPQTMGAVVAAVAGVLAPAR